MSPIRRLDPFKRNITRRTFLKLSGAAAASATLGPGLVRAQGSGGTLRILQWSHFVPAYDTWFDVYAQEWGAANGINVVVDHINLADLTTAVAAEISAGAGHDLIEIVGAEAGQFEPSLLSLTDLNREAESRFGPLEPVAHRYSYNPATENYYGFCAGWTIDPANYRRSLWEAADMGDGPVTWEDLVTAGGRIRDEQGVQLGIGLAQEIDSNMAHRAIMSSFDAALQNENGEVILDQGENFERVLESVQFMQRLYEAAMTPEVFAWNAASNNQALIAGRASYIMNSISAYRSSQDDVPDIAEDVFFGPALEGPRGTAWANAHVIYNYVVPQHAGNPDGAQQFILDLAENYDIAEDVFFGPALQGPRGTAWANAHVIYNYVVPQHAGNPDGAQQFILDLAENYDMAMYHSKLYNSSSFFDAPVTGNGDYPAVAGANTFRDLHNAWFTNDPFKLPNEADGKLLPLINATDWTTNVGHPGVCSPAVAEVYNTFVVPNMFARAVRGDQTPEESIRTAAAEANAVFDAWRERGLV